MKSVAWLLALAVCATAHAAVEFQIHSAKSGNWSDAKTWAEGRLPKAGERVQIREGHRVVYDVESDQAIRMIHVAGTLSFARDRSTRLDVGLLRISGGETADEDGFVCHGAAELPVAKGERPVLEIGTLQEPIPTSVTATIRLVYFDGMDREKMPAIINCGGRWDAHGAPMSRTWVKLGATVRPQEKAITLSEAVNGWRVGARVIVTASKEVEGGSTFRPGRNRSAAGNTEERIITAIDGLKITLDRPLEKEHFGEGDYRSEVANLSRNVIIESADPDGVRGHTMYHLNSTGGLSYVEFRHLGKEAVLGKYPVHFHLVRDSMRGSAAIGLSIWDSHNRFMAIHGTDYLLIRDCVGYQSVGHGFFLEDGTEQYNILDRNLAVQAYRGKRLKQQALPFDANEGAGFWWANGRNTFTRNVACENDEYGYRFEILKASNFDPKLKIRDVDGKFVDKDVRTIPFLRFEGNESHSEGLYSFNFGDDRNPSVQGDREHPFIARNLVAWQTHYALRPNVQYFLMEGFKSHDGVYGVYHPDYDAHVYRDIYIYNATAEPINRAHDDDSIQYGSFTYENLTLENCKPGRDPLIQMACTSPKEGQTGHFKNVIVKNSRSRGANIVDLGGGPRNKHLEHPVAYYFHDYFGPARVTKVLSGKFPEAMTDGEYKPIDGFTGKDVKAADVGPVVFPTLLEPVDDAPPATIITSVVRDGEEMKVRGVSQDNGEIDRVLVNGSKAELKQSAPGVVDWEVKVKRSDVVEAKAVDGAGNEEKMPQRRLLR
ncbi:MAG TPA: G8 domain-containing protein [Tepidisphaeraceae bacterium]|nr:G8 domain-containing protein [Tepidisphaeraceae bacterium]